MRGGKVGADELTLQRQLAGRQFMLRCEVSDIPFDGPTPDADRYAIQTAKEGVWALVTDNGAFMQSEELQKKAEWRISPTPPTVMVQLQIQFTAEEFLDYGFEVSEQLHYFTKDDTDKSGDPLRQFMTEIGVPQLRTEIKLLWRDSEAHDWHWAAYSRGARFDRDVKRLRTDEDDSTNG